jgi:hypothetical protein
MLPTTLVAIVVTALAITLIATGCGSSSKSRETGSSANSNSVLNSAASSAPATKPTGTVTVVIGKPLSHARWIAKGDAICRRLLGELTTLSVKSTAEYPRVLPQGAAFMRTALAQLAKLVPPTSQAKDWNEFLNTNLQWAEASEALAKFGYLGKAITKSQQALIQQKLERRGIAIATRDGFKVCSRV